MKKRIVLLAVMLVFVLACASAVSESLFVDNRETDRIYPERLNLRDQPSKSGGIIGLYYTGAEVENLGQENEEFTKVHIGGVTGYMASEYLITGEEAAARYGEDSGFGTCREAQVDLTGMWQTTVPLRMETDLQSESAGEIENGALVSLVGILDDWAYIAAEKRIISAERCSYCLLFCQILRIFAQLNIIHPFGPYCNGQTDIIRQHFA